MGHTAPEYRILQYGRACKQLQHIFTSVYHCRFACTYGNIAHACARVQVPAQTATRESSRAFRR